MIVRMKKVSLLVLDRSRAESLRELRRLGTVHVQERPGGGEELAGLREQQARLEKARQLLPLEEGRKSRGPAPAGGLARALVLAGEIEACAERQKAAQDRAEQLRREEERLAPWGDFRTADLRELREAGLEIHLYEAEEKQLAKLPEGVDAFVVGRGRGLARLAVVTRAGERPELPFTAVPAPERGLAQVREAGARAREEKRTEEEALRRLAAERAHLEAGLAEVGHRIEFETVRTGMAQEGPVAYLSGFIPVTRLEGLRKAASSSGWGLAIEDPAEDDAVPTLVANPRWIRIIQPVFDLLGTVPGYREVDLSFFFLVFFTLFFAMLIGDAGYGLLILGFTIYARVKLRKARPEPFILFFVLAAGTILWGVVTGTWFGVEAIAKQTFLSRLVIPRLATFGEDNSQFIMYICFTIGLVHLSLAHLIGFLRGFPRLVAYGEIGQLAIVWGMFFVIKYILLQQPLNPAGIWLVIGGLVLVTFFAEQKGRFLKGFLLGLGKLPLKALNSISTFSDIVSYVRLFAVGLAGIEISKAFNALSAGIGFGFPNVIFAVLIALFGHSLNMVLGAMSVIVHGIRLNVLEFSSHIGMEWVGFTYRPFKEEKSEGDRE